MNNETVEITTIQQALDWGDEWRRAYLRLELKLQHEQDRTSYYEALLRYLDPFLPRWLQDKYARAENSDLYRVIENAIWE